jgi:hypothetical protein
VAARGAIAPVALAVALALSSIAETLDAAECIRRQLPLDGVLTLSAAPAPDGNLLIVDFVVREVVEYDFSNDSWQALPGIPGDALRSQRPEVIRAFDGGLLVRQSSGGFVEMDHNLAVKRGPVHQLAGATGADGRVLGSVSLFEPADGRHLTTCSDVYLGRGDKADSRNWTTAMVRVPLDDPAAFEVLHAVDYNGDTALGCRLTLPMVAALGERSYLLALEAEGTAIYEASPGAEPRRLRAFPARFASPAALPLDPTREQIPAVWGEMERSTMPVGIYGWEDALYVLSRSPGASGTDWWLTRIDPAQDAETGTVQLGTRANHLLVVPGDRYWALIEKGPVESSFWDQDVTGIVAVSAEQIRVWRPDQLICGAAAP